MVSIIRFFLVVLATCFLWMVGLRIFVNWLTVKVGWRKASKGLVASWPIWIQICVVGFMILSIVVVFWSFAEPYFPIVERVQIRSPKISAPIRIVHLSDFHSDPVVRAEAKVSEMVRRLNPDLIVFTGDGVNSDEGIPVFKKTMNALAHIAPVYGVRGNWEVWWFTHVDSFADTGIHELNGKAIPVIIRGNILWLGGTAVESESLIDAATAPMAKNAFRVFLHHYPAAWSKLNGKVDLLLSGDTHGGQLVFPLLGPLVRVSRWDGRFYQSGLHQIGDMWLYVNRGIGMEGNGVPRTRFLCPPEVTLIELVPE